MTAPDRIINIHSPSGILLKTKAQKQSLDIAKQIVLDFWLIAQKNKNKNKKQEESTHHFYCSSVFLFDALAVQKLQAQSKEQEK